MILSNSHLRTPSLQGTKAVGERESKGLQKIRTHGISTERDWQKSRKVWVWQN